MAINLIHNTNYNDFRPSKNEERTAVKSEEQKMETTYSLQKNTRQEHYLFLKLAQKCFTDINQYQ
jgi:uncharacterized protein YxeA